MKELINATKQMNQILHQCEEDGDTFDTTLNKLSRVKVHGVIFPTLMLMEIIDKFAEGYKERQKKIEIPASEEEYKKEDHHPTAGCLEFLGSMPNHFARHSYIAKPKVGEFYLFPSWLTHQVYPFRSEGERRSLAFNIHFTFDAPVKGVDV